MTGIRMRFRSVLARGSALLALAIFFCDGALAQPTANPAPLTAQVNTPVTVDLAPFITGAGITGITVATPPSQGTTFVNGTSVTYTPANSFFGADSFTYIAFGVGGASAPGLVTVTVSGRPDPGADRAITGMLAAQIQTARRFAAAQVSNFQRRMEWLHRRPDNAAGPPAPVKPAGLSLENATAAGPRGIVPEQGLFASTTDAPAPFTLNLAAAATGGPRPRSGDGPGAPSFWIDGTINFGSLDATAGRNTVDFRTNGVSFGVDRRFGDRLVLGAGAGIARDRADIGGDGTQNRAHGYSITGYASYELRPNLFIDSLIGIGLLDIDTRRFVAPVNAYAQGNRDGHQLFGSVAAGYEHREGGLLLSPYARLDVFADRLKQGTESGAGQYALTYFGESSSALRAAVGARAELIRRTEYGWAVPRARVELQHDFQGNRSDSAAYADLAGGPRFTVPTGRPRRDALVLGLGSDFVLRDGLTLGVDYQLAHAFSNDTNHAIRFTISKDLDGRGPSALGGVVLLHARPIGIQVDAGIVFDDNVTRSRTHGEKFSDSSYSANLGKTEVFPLGDNSRALMTLMLGGEKFRTYDGLSRISGGVRGEYQYRASAEWGTPTLSVFGRAQAEIFESTLRNGFRYTAGVSIRQPVTDRIALFGALAHNERYGKSAVFVNRDNSARANLDYALSKNETIYLGAEYRRGDIVSTGGPSLENVSIAKVLVPDDAYPGRQFFSYRLDANTVLWTAGYNIGFGPRDSLDISWRRVESTPHQRVFYSVSPESYIVNQYSITYIMRF